jgi:hypothetical protein
MALIGYSGAWRKLICEKNRKLKISYHTPFNQKVGDGSPHLSLAMTTESIRSSSNVFLEKPFCHANMFTLSFVPSHVYTTCQGDLTTWGSRTEREAEPGVLKKMSLDGLAKLSQLRYS